MRHTILASAVLIAGAQISMADDVVLAFCYDTYPPYALDDAGSASGLKITLLEEVIAQLDGVTATVTLLPWRRCQRETANGRFDGILPLFQNSEREGYMVFTEDTFQEASVFWYNRSRFPDGLEWSGDYAEFDGLTLGMINGSFHDSAMEAAFAANGEILRAVDISALFLMLQHERVDLIATDAAVGRHHTHISGTRDLFAFVERPIAVHASQFGLSRVRGADAYLDDFNAAIAMLRDQGRLDDLLNSTP
ncbi:MAG: transporter substrate-binding domain-containing protein [Pseudomonadota bacterium]